jgi:hypothetical protein
MQYQESSNSCDHKISEDRILRSTTFLILCLIVYIGYIGTATSLAEWRTILTLDVRRAYEADEFFVGPAGDLNGDGFDDFFVGEPNYNVGQGYLKVIYGSAEPDTTTGWVAQIPNAHPSYFGAWADVIDDMDGDGHPEVAVGAPLYGSSYWGLVFLFETEPFDTLYDYYFSGEYQGFGGFQSQGDFNNDGYRDLLIGDSFSRPFFWSVAAYLFFGAPELDTNVDWQIVNSVDEEILIMQMVPGSGGDFNGDGYDDFSISEIIYYDEETITTETGFFFGGQVIDTIPDFSISERKIDWAGDINNDGMSDFIASRYDHDSLCVKIFYGNDNADTLHSQILYNTSFEPGELKFHIQPFTDFNGDGYTDLLILRGPDSENFTYMAELLFGGADLDTIPDEVFGITNIYRGFADIGDINGNGTEELLVKQSFSVDSLVTSIFTRDPVSIDDESICPQSSGLMLMAYPNPFNTSTLISLPGQRVSEAQLDIFDVCGRKVRSFRLDKDNNKTIVWDAENENGLALATGVYFLRAMTPYETLSKKVLYLK